MSGWVSVWVIKKEFGADACATGTTFELTGTLWRAARKDECMWSLADDGELFITLAKVSLAALDCSDQLIASIQLSSSSHQILGRIYVLGLINFVRKCSALIKPRTDIHPKVCVCGRALVDSNIPLKLWGSAALCSCCATNCCFVLVQDRWLIEWKGRWTHVAISFRWRTRSWCSNCYQAGTFLFLLPLLIRMRILLMNVVGLQVVQEDSSHVNYDDMSYESKRWLILFVVLDNRCCGTHVVCVQVGSNAKGA